MTKVTTGMTASVTSEERALINEVAEIEDRTFRAEIVWLFKRRLAELKGESK